MTDVSHELGALRFVVDSSLSSKVAMFNNQANQVQQSQLLNPFSASNNGRTSPKPTFSKDQYGKPLAGSLTEMRGQKANIHVMKEMLELCQIIDSEGYKVNDEPNMRVIPFGELFNIYNYISDKVVGILLRARKYKYVQFEGEMLFQRRDDDVPVFLLRPILDIRHEIDSKVDMLKRSTSPAPMATTLLQDKGAHQQKLQEAALNVPAGSGKRSPSKSRSPSPAVKKSTEAASALPPKAPATKATPAATPAVEPAVQNETPAETTPKSDVASAAGTAPLPTNGDEQQPAQIDEAPTPVESAVSSSNSGNLEPATIESPTKTDLNNNHNDSNNSGGDTAICIGTGSDVNIIINELPLLPTIIIEATAIIGCSEDDTTPPRIVEVEGTLDNFAPSAAATTTPTTEAATSPENPPPQEAVQ